MVAPGYNHIWDCCCDHGLLGASLIQRQAAADIHLVDIVPELIDSLSKKLEQYFPANPECRWHTHCLDIAKLPLSKPTSSPLSKHQESHLDSADIKHLVIIAGIGGDLMAQLVTEIAQTNPNQNIDFLICPVHQLYHVRQQLISLNMRLKEEVLVKENNRFYEILLLSNKQIHSAKASCITPAGDAIWHTNPQQGQEYLAQTLQHYQRMQRGLKHCDEKNLALNTIIDAYQKIAIA